MRLTSLARLFLLVAAVVAVPAGARGNPIGAPRIEIPEYPRNEVIGSMWPLDGCPDPGRIEQCYGPGLYWTGRCSDWRPNCTPRQPYLPGYKAVYAGYHPDWYASGEMLALFRDTDRSVPFATQGPDPTAVVLSSSSFDGNYAAGVKVLVGRQLAPRYRLEGSWFGNHTWGDEATFFDPTGNLFSPFSNFTAPGTAGRDFNQRATISFSSQLNNIELNLRHRINLPSRPVEASFLLGARYIKIDEEFHYGTVDGTAITNQVDVDTGNDLIAVQAGIQSQFLLTQKLWLDWDIKGGIAQNRASQATVYTVTPGAAIAGRRTEDVTSFIGETGLSLNYQFLPSVTFRAGYQALWVTGLALADQNFNNNVSVLTMGPAALDDTGEVVYHGLNLGVVWAR